MRFYRSLGRTESRWKSRKIHTVWVPWALAEHCIGVEPWWSGGPWPSHFFSPQSRRGRVLDVVDGSIIILSCSFWMKDAWFAFAEHAFSRV